MCNSGQTAPAGLPDQTTAGAGQGPIRDGTDNGTPDPNNPDANTGLHEPASFYADCDARERNGGLYTDAVRFSPTARLPPPTQYTPVPSVSSAQFHSSQAVQAKRDAEAVAAHEDSRSQAITSHLARVAKKSAGSQKEGWQVSRLW